MKYKKMIPIFVAAMLISGCASNTTKSSPSDVLKNIDKSTLTNVTGTMVPLKDSTLLEGSKISYTRDDEGYIYKINFHKVNTDIPFDEEKMSIDGTMAYLDDSQIEEWKQSKSQPINRPGYSVKTVYGDRLDVETARKVAGVDIVYKVTSDYKINVFTASKDDVKAFANSLGLKVKSRRITEASLNNILTPYNMELKETAYAK